MSGSGLLPVSGLWIGDSLPPLARLTMASFVSHGHPYRLYSYRKFENVPAGVDERDAGEVLPDWSGHMRNVAAFSDWFRWELLSREAGWWVDMDTVCLKPLDIGGELAFGLDSPPLPGVPLARSFRRILKLRNSSSRAHAGPMINGAVLKSTDPGNALVRRMLGYCRRPEMFSLRSMLRLFNPKGHAVLLAKSVGRGVLGHPRSEIRHWLRSAHKAPMSGPWGLTDEVVFMGLLRHVRPQADFFPVYWRHWETLYDGTYAGVDDPFPDSYAVHVWNSMSSRRRPASGSFVDRMLRRYSVEWE